MKVSVGKEISCIRIIIYSMPFIIFCNLPESKNRMTAAVPLMKTNSIKKSYRFSIGYPIKLLLIPFSG